MKSVIIGTAGHIDHGKTALVRALTGIDADRLEEEKRRGITIDLGFAHVELFGPSGEELRLGTALGEEAQAVVQVFRQSKLESSHAEPPEMSDRFQVSG